MAPLVDPNVMDFGDLVGLQMGFWGENPINIFIFLVLVHLITIPANLAPGEQIRRAILCFLINYPGPGIIKLSLPT